MGWANCGTDEKGRPIGYAVSAVCDHKSCHTKIDRGLSFVCGDMHGGGDHGCGKYFCTKHLFIVKPKGTDKFVSLCSSCSKTVEEDEN